MPRHTTYCHHAMHHPHCWTNCRRLRARHAGEGGEAAARNFEDFMQNTYPDSARILQACVCGSVARVLAIVRLRGKAV